MTDRNKTYKAKATHEIWSHWMKYMFEQCEPVGPNGTLVIPKNLEERWKRQMNTSFYGLTLKEQESNYEMADKFLKRI